MGVYFKVIFLGFLLNGNQWVSRGQGYPRPSISLTPSTVVPVGGKADIHCKSGGYNQVEFHLLKVVSASLRTLKNKTSDTDEVVFSISNAKQSDGGNYSCLFRFNSHGYQMWSDYSEAVYLNITAMPKPREPMTVVWVSCTTGLFLLLLLLLSAFFLYRKRKQGLTVKETKEPVNMSLQPEDEADSSDVAYASLDHRLQKNKLAVSSDRAPDSCIYTLLAEGRTMKGQQGDLRAADTLGTLLPP